MAERPLKDLGTGIIEHIREMNDSANRSDASAASRSMRSTGPEGSSPGPAPAPAPGRRRASGGPAAHSVQDRHTGGDMNGSGQIIDPEDNVSARRRVDRVDIHFGETRSDELPRDDVAPVAQMSVPRTVGVRRFGQHGRGVDHRHIEGPARPRE